MKFSLDARVPVVIGDRPEMSGDLRWIVPTGLAGHDVACACCARRGEAAVALAGLFAARARGEVPWFTRVVAVCSGPDAETALRAALDSDPVVSGRFRPVAL